VHNINPYLFYVKTYLSKFQETSIFYHDNSQQ